MLRTVLIITSPDIKNSYVVIICETYHEMHIRNSYVVHSVNVLMILHWCLNYYLLLETKMFFLNSEIYTIILLSKSLLNCLPSSFCCSLYRPGFSCCKTDLWTMVLYGRYINFSFKLLTNGVVKGTFISLFMVISCISSRAMLDQFVPVIFETNVPFLKWSMI